MINLTPLFGTLFMSLGIGNLMLVGNFMGSTFTINDFIGLNIPFYAIALWGTVVCNIHDPIVNPKA
jgi:hypothetical protein